MGLEGYFSSVNSGFARKRKWEGGSSGEKENVSLRGLARWGDNGMPSASRMELVSKAHL